MSLTIAPSPLKSVALERNCGDTCYTNDFKYDINYVRMK